jgi:hypothetical protein
MKVVEKLAYAYVVGFGIVAAIGVAYSLPRILGIAGLSVLTFLGTIPLWGWIVIVLLLVVLGRQRCS